MISIVIPVYNVEKYLDTCLNSIVNQTFKDLEIILVNDGSKDASGLKCNQWADKDNRIIVIHQENRGLSAARNIGIDRATGEYLMFVDSDDVVSNKICEILYNVLKNNDADLSICGTKHIFSENDCIFDSFYDKTYCFSAEEAICSLWYQSNFLPSAWGKLYKRRLFDNIRFTEGIIFEDIDIMHEVFYQCKKIVYNETPVYGYVHHENSITTNNYSKKDNIILNICDKITSFSSDKSDNLKKAAMSYNVTGALRVYLNAPDNTEYKEAVDKAKNILKLYGKKVLKDKNIRKKNKYALYLYFYCRPVLKLVYKKIDRWK